MDRDTFRTLAFEKRSQAETKPIVNEHVESFCPIILLNDKINGFPFGCNIIEHIHGRFYLSHGHNLFIWGFKFAFNTVQVISQWVVFVDRGSQYIQLVKVLY